jgi:GAF domain-containing protein
MKKAPNMAGKFNLTKAFNPEEKTRTLYKSWRENFIVPLLWSILLFGPIILVPSVISAKNAVLNTVFTTVYLIIALVTFIRFSYEFRVWMFLLSLYILSVSELIRYNILGDSNIFFLGLIVLATMLHSPRAGIITTVVSALTCIVIGFLMMNGYVRELTPISTEVSTLDWISGTVVIVALGTVVILGFQKLEDEFFGTQKQADDTLNQLQEERANLEEKVQERTTKLRRFNEIGRTITAILDPDELLARATSLIADEFECYFSAVFLLDVTEQWAELKEATGEAGKVLSENKFRVDLRGKSLTSAAIRTRQVRVLQDTGSDPVHTDNPLLPYTRSQISIPLAIGEHVIGALELHSTQSAAFQQQEADTYQNLANQIAVAYENARLFKESQQSLAEMRATQRQYLQGSWSSLDSEKKLQYEIGDRDITGNEMSVPLALRDQIIGQIQMATNENLTLEQKNLVESIATQAALALENARLVEESQSIAARERLANEIIAKVWASTNMESILQTTVRELGRALEAAEVEIQVSTEGGNE